MSPLRSDATQLVIVQLGRVFVGDDVPVSIRDTIQVPPPRLIAPTLARFTSIVAKHRDEQHALRFLRRPAPKPFPTEPKRVLGPVW